MPASDSPTRPQTATATASRCPDAAGVVTMRNAAPVAATPTSLLHRGQPLIASRVPVGVPAIASSSSSEIDPTWAVLLKKKNPGSMPRADRV